MIFFFLLLLRSTKKIGEDDTEIPITTIRYIQIGNEELQEAHRTLNEPEKSQSSDPASLYISSSRRGIRIRLPDAEFAASLAAELRKLM
jgi:hypothetical protein